MNSDSVPEPWLRGPLEGVDPVVAQTLRSFQQAREELLEWTAGLSDEQMWARPHGLLPLGFHLNHIAGSVDRLTTYLKGAQLDVVQIDFLQHEMDEGTGSEELLRQAGAALAKSEAVIRAIDPSTFSEPRGVGRERLPTTVAGLVVHLAEHTQRHVGQAIVTAKLLRAG
jgi:uncharacterized damage-inducible protein DinB